MESRLKYGMRSVHSLKRKIIFYHCLYQLILSEVKSNRRRIRAVLNMSKPNVQMSIIAWNTIGGFSQLFLFINKVLINYIIQYLDLALFKIDSEKFPRIEDSRNDFFKYLKQNI